MKLPVAFLILFTSFAVLFPSRGADIIPKRTDFGRYQAMLDHSPFAVATAAALPAATPNFAKDLYIANAARSSEGDLLTLGNLSDRNFKEYLNTRAPNEHGYAIASIEWSDAIGGTKATISKDGQFATISFNQALISTPASGSAPQPAQAPAYRPPGQFPNPAPTPAVTRPMAPTIPPAHPRVRGVIPRNPNAVPPTPQQAANEQDQ